MLQGLQPLLGFCIFVWNDTRCIVPANDRGPSVSWLRISVKKKKPHSEDTSIGTPPCAHVLSERLRTAIRPVHKVHVDGEQ